MLHYCRKCGRIVQEVYGNDKQICDYCLSILYPVPNEYLHESKVYIKDEYEQKFIDEYIKSSSEFDQYLFDHRDEDLRKRWSEQEAKLAHGKAISKGRDKGNKFGIECPYCHATNIRKITVTSKAMHTALFGVFSMGRNSKQWHCDHCNSDF